MYVIRFFSIDEPYQFSGLKTDSNTETDRYPVTFSIIFFV